MTKGKSTRSNKTRPTKGRTLRAEVKSKTSLASKTTPPVRDQDPPIFVKPGSLVISVEGKHNGTDNRLKEKQKATGFDYIHSNSAGQVLGMDFVDPNNPTTVIQKIPLPAAPFWLRIRYT